MVIVNDKGRSLGGMNCVPKGGWKVTVKQMILKRSEIAFILCDVYYSYVVTPMDNQFLKSV